MIGSRSKTLLRYLRMPATRSADDFAASITAELAFHLAERTQEFIDQGMTLDAARAAALERFGSPARIAAECHAGSLRGLSFWHRLHLASTVVLALMVAARSRHAWRSLDATRNLASHVPPGIFTMLAHDWTGDVGPDREGQRPAHRGSSCAGRGQSLAGRVVFSTRVYGAVSDTKGRFLIENVHPIDERYAVQIAAIVDNRVIKSSYARRDGGVLEPIVLSLLAAPDLALQVEALDGSTLSGVEVLPHGRVEAGGSEHSVYFDRRIAGPSDDVRPRCLALFRRATPRSCLFVSLRGIGNRESLSCHLSGRWPPFGQREVSNMRGTIIWCCWTLAGILDGPWDRCRGTGRQGF